MAKKQYSLIEQIELITEEMCRDLGIEPEDLDRRKEFRKAVEKHLQEDALHRAKEKLWNGKLDK